jgi:hypothetical protein
VGSKLSDAANQAINDATLDSSFVPGETEPSLVARLVAALPDLLVAAWSPYFVGKQLYVTSVFCHHIPQVHWDHHKYGWGRPELGDLLIIVSSPDASGNVTDHALLVQAKLNEKGPNTTLSKKGDIKQRYMYARWPAFHFGNACRGAAHKCSPSLKRYTLNSSNLHGDATRYGVVSLRHRPTWNLESSAATWKVFPKNGKAKCKTFDDINAMPVLGQVPLGNALVHMVKKSLGRSLHRPEDADWEDVVNELIFQALRQMNAPRLRHAPPRLGTPVIPIASAAAFVPAPLSSTPMTFFEPVRTIANYPHYDLGDLFSAETAWYCGAAPSNGSGKKIPEMPDSGYPQGGFGIIRIRVDGELNDLD